MVPMSLPLLASSTLPVFVTLEAGELPPDSYQLIHVVERSEGKLLGGVSYLVVNTKQGGQRQAGPDKEQQP